MIFKMRHQLKPGYFYGQTIRKRFIGDLTLTQVEYHPRSRIPRHSHERAYFCLIRRGTYVERFSRRTRICGPMMLVFHPPGEPHSEAFGDDPVASFNVEFGAEWLDRLREVGGTFDQGVEFRSGWPITLGLQLFNEFEREDADSNLSIECTMLEILDVYANKQPAKANSARPNWLRRACENLDSCLDQPLSLRQLANNVGVHPIYLAAVFRRFYGCSVGEYVRRRRIEYARRLLRLSDISLAEIALGAGFADQSHFTRDYKRFTGRTPSQDRTFLRFKT